MKKKYLLLLLVIVVAVGLVFVTACQTTKEPTSVTRNFNISIGHNDAYARPALVEASKAPEETKITTFYKWKPSVLVVFTGDKVVLNVTNDSKSRVHSFDLEAFGAKTGDIGPAGEENPQPITKTVEFVADKAGIFEYKCNIPPDATSDPKRCSPEHEYQTGYLIVLDR